MADIPTYQELEKRVKQLEKEVAELNKSGEELGLFKTIIESSQEAIAIRSCREVNICKSNS